MNLMDKLRGLFRNDDWIDAFKTDDDDLPIHPEKAGLEKPAQQPAENAALKTGEIRKLPPEQPQTDVEQFRQVLDKHFTPPKTSATTEKKPEKTFVVSEPQAAGEPDARHLKVLKKGVLVWNRWRVHNRTIRPDLRNARLAGMDFSFYILDGVDFRGADLRNCNFWHARLNNAVLNGANLSGAILQDANLKGAHLDGTNLQNIIQKTDSTADTAASHVLLPQNLQSSG